MLSSPRFTRYPLRETVPRRGCLLAENHGQQRPRIQLVSQSMRRAGANRPPHFCVTCAWKKKASRASWGYSQTTVLSEAVKTLYG